MTEQTSAINITPKHLMAFTGVILAFTLAVVYLTTSLVVNSQKASAQQQNNNGAAPQLVVSEGPNAANGCVDADAAKSGESDASSYKAGDVVRVGGKKYTVMGVVPSNTTQINEDNDTHYTSMVDSRNSGNTDIVMRNNGNTQTFNKNNGNTTIKTNNSNQGNTSNSGNSNVQDSGNVATNTDNSNQGNTSNSGNSNVQDSGNVLNLNNGNTTNSNNKDNNILVL